MACTSLRGARLCQPGRLT